MKFPFHGAGAAKLGEDVSQLPPGTRLEPLDAPRDPAVNVAEDMLKILPSGGFRVRVRIEFADRMHEAEIDVALRKGGAA